MEQPKLPPGPPNTTPTHPILPPPNRYYPCTPTPLKNPILFENFSLSLLTIFFLFSLYKIVSPLRNLVMIKNFFLLNLIIMFSTLEMNGPIAHEQEKEDHDFYSSPRDGGLRVSYDKVRMFICLYYLSDLSIISAYLLHI